MSDFELAQSVSDVQRLMGQCVETARAEDSADGYFPLVYLWETRDLEARAGDFDAPDRLREMIVAFANQYFTARGRFRAGQPAPRAWTLAFEAARTSSALVVEQLLLCMNAHINLDLGVAAAETQLVGADFGRVDTILDRAVEGIQKRLNRTSLVLRAVDLFGGTFDELFAIYSLTAARQHALSVANRLLATPEARRAGLIAEVDAQAFAFGQMVLRPPLRVRLVLALARLAEPTVGPRHVMDMLALD